MEMNFCRRCGTELTKKGPGFFICENNHQLFGSSIPTVGVFFLTQNNEIVFAVRGVEPNKGTLNAIGGFIDERETTEESLQREILEETGLTPDQYEKPAFFCTAHGNYPYDGEDRVVLCTFFWSRLKSTAKIHPADDVAAIKIIPLDNVNPEEIGNEDVRTAFKMLPKFLKDLQVVK